MTTRGNALVTGASSGIGAAIAMLLAEQGYRVWGTTRSLDRVESLPQELRDRVRFVAMDVTDDASVTDGVEKILEQAQSIDLLVNNAGGAVYGPIEEMPMELTIKQFDLNVFGLLRVTQAVVPHMRERRQGMIINISSLAGKLVIPYQTHYSASKHAVEAFTEGLRQELRPFGIKVVSILPGDINTNFNNATTFAPQVQGGQSPYEPWLKASWETIDVNLRRAPGPEVVARQVWKAVEDQGRKGRYPAGDFASRQFLTLARLLPDSLKEWAIRVFYRIKF
ncbi:MAG: SDR family oxidoreductase [Firmicutes bacterium]|nr:SDR family oxidoreductase [Bacillota bacterium]